MADWLSGITYNLYKRLDNTQHRAISGKHCQLDNQQCSVCTCVDAVYARYSIILHARDLVQGHNSNLNKTLKTSYDCMLLTLPLGVGLLPLLIKLLPLGLFLSGCSPGLPVYTSRYSCYECQAAQPFPFAPFPFPCCWFGAGKRRVLEGPGQLM